MPTRNEHIIRLALAQINPTVGDMSGNQSKITGYIEKAKAQGADLVLFPELSSTGYPPEDLLLKPQFVADNISRIETLRLACNGIVGVVGFIDGAGDLYNSASVLERSTPAVVYHKMLLPNYGVFDEDRYFTAGKNPLVFRVNEVKVGITICEDIWHTDGPMVAETREGARLILNLSASPYQKGKILERERMLATRAVDNHAAVAYVNMVGGQDELVFDGGSMVLNEDGEVIARACQFDEQLLVCDLSLNNVGSSLLPGQREQDNTVDQGPHIPVFTIDRSLRSKTQPEAANQITPVLEAVAEIYQALVTGTRDYVRKNGFQKVVLGLSGGVDSSLVAAIAVDALGCGNVIGVAMPSRFTAEQSNADAATLASGLAIELRKIAIEDIYISYLETMKSQFGERPHDIAEQNIQARIRGNILMALSNKFGWLVLTTGNKSEVATGYCTLYGDMAGGFAVIKDVPKTMVYQLSRYRNQREGREVIPQSVLEREPTAELAPGQRDSDSLPVYSQLDPILAAYIEEDLSFGQLIKRGFDPKVVRKVIDLVDHSEYKRRQSAPGVKITARAFGRDRRLPITNHYRET
jgi:NAD+ synthase (glutamine-hydrolysing)